jgi:signal transduction histidine kinase/ligand-binding sensor domain-containing protein
MTFFALALCRSASALDPSLDVSQYAHSSWLFREGFAQGQVVTSLAQTPDGYLWLGTELGLLRFDGVRSTAWHPPGHERLPHTWIRTLLTARDGTLWIGTLEGLASLTNGTLTRYPELDGYSVNTLVEDREGTVWAGSAGLTARLCAITGGRTQCDGSSFGQWVGALYEDRAGTLWATAQTGLWRLGPGARRQYAMANPATSSQALNESRDGKLLVAAADGVRQLVEGTGVAHPLPGAPTGFKPERLLRDRDGGLWIGTMDRGLAHVQRGRTDFYTRANGLSGDFVTRIFEDREGNVWVATKNGLDRFRDLAVRTITANQGLPSAPPWSVLPASDGSVWLGSLDGVSRWRNGHATVYRTSASRSAERHAPEAETARVREIFDSGLPDDGAGTLAEDSEGRIWVSTLRGVAYFQNEHFTTVGQIPAGRSPAIATDDAGSLWIVNEAQGLYRLRNAVVVEHIPWTALGLPRPATSILPDPVNGGVWLGLPGRVVYVKDASVQATFTADAGLGEGRVNHFRVDRNGGLWVAMENGLSYIRDGRVVTLTSRNGLPCDAVHWSMEDRDHSVWLYMSCGLARVASTELNAAVLDGTRTIRPALLDSADGVALRSLPALYRPRVAQTADGNLWFLPGDGVSILDPHRLSVNTLPPPVHIERVTADRTIHEPAEHLRLPSLVHDLEIDYTALSLVAPEKNRFRVKLEGRDAEWQDAGNRRQAFYSDLAPGRYRFRVTGSNNSGVWSEAGAFIDFSVAPAYYQTIWFRAGAVAAFLGLLWVLYQVRLRQLAHAFNLRLDERVNERTRIARELHDTLLQSFQGLMLRFQSARNLLPAQPAEAIAALEGALDRADQAIVESRDAIQNLRSTRTASDALPQAMASLAQELANGPGGEEAASFRLSVEGAPRDLHPVVCDDIQRIAREALRNAFRHAQADHIEAEVTYGAREIRLRVRDDGRGIDPTDLSTGRARHWGLASMRERAVQIGAQLDLWSEIGAGTEVELRVPGLVAYGASFGRRRLFRPAFKSPRMS